MRQLNFNPNHIKLHNKWSILLLLILSVAIVYPFYHIHHIHSVENLVLNDGSLTNTDHISDHHDEDESTHTNDHTHKYDNHVDWQFFRPQSNSSALSNDELIVQDVQNLFYSQKVASRSNLFERQQPSELHTFISTIRGPPHLS
ncbi:MAG: hypothetical protein HN356_08515 [Calditrichaeota bacterium]|jgi:hypothetical protein|nr:hypothetical protein [Calditrichota bacterium]MBT7619394.1 hypothetical protein [Calditrichota bacterium]